MPHRRPKPSIVLGAVAALAVASPFAVYGVTSTTSDVRTTNESVPTVVPPEIAEVVLASVPDIVIPIHELTGLNLPDLSLRELAAGLPEIAAPAPSTTPAPAPAAADVVDRIGATVKQLTRDAPFSMIALAAKDVADTDARIRAQREDGSWGPWTATEPIDTSRDDQTPDERAGTEPIYVGATKVVQVLLTPRPKPEPTLAGAEIPAPTPAPAPAPTPAPAPAPTQPELGYAPASSSRPLHAQEPAATEDVSAVLIDPGSSSADAALDDIAGPVGGSGPKVITRAQWGADESIRCQDATYDDSLGGATVHHTAGSNDYSKAESAEIVRAIYAYHAQTLGWCDVGYNVLVDRYGQIFEGRAGGLDKPVQGAHAGGFNENTVGIAMMGDFSNVEPPKAAVDAVGRFLGWRLAKAGLDPEGETTMYSEGTSFTPYPQGAAVDLPIIFAHRDVGNTSCPGDSGYAKMDEIRDIAAATAAGQSTTPSEPSDDSSDLVTDNPRAQVPDVDAGAPATGSADRLPDTGSADRLPDTGSAEKVADLVGELIRLTDNSPLAQKWIAEGGETGRLGAAVSGILPAKAGYERAEFVNGAIYTSPNGGVWTVLGEIYKTWQRSGLDAGELGLPTSDEYRVPDGWRSDFEFGSLIFNELTGAVTKVLRAYNDAYEQAQTPAAAPAPEAPAPAPEAPASAPVP
ncbi:N-acetylmuramoyl-L-alanine amidase [Rhodococcus ruber]|uniref:Cold-shock protein n=1 Tax=Rhodococcus ruber TaxID=1830 RepID=A0A098BI22_9NOCA|nr:N-acetylmuramoyl-L-alanine amidase [Rhodococcus ruber]MCD2128991.1 N-acetylmuramoyl-L-alanine amidase [Rhodococcus ruber]MCZ4505574.1 N-acetylmuramoyl-L-alanine amidase [Rhodococcus ruber]MCZ4532672.1 N-acetylmuramoyl-L-alanine amidase [Rhodococcus ruber]MCZ4623226.1 N-acetylmuramoyl-L-alanine amidase [Rhodococcus ruber]MDI9970711.1 N-acetylmuramoyl-L-alanine amidase [Rhodococcus ruber]